MLISIIIPVFNVEQYLRECLDSIVNQTLRDIEIICVNDGSLDGSLAILEEYAEKDSRIKIINKSNEGQAIARNLAMRYASGEYIMFIDSDDHVDITLCEEIYGYATKHKCDMVIYDYFSFSDIKEISKQSKISVNLSNVSPSDKKTLLEQMGVVWTKCVRTDFVRAHTIRFPASRIYEDIFVHWELVILSQTTGILPLRLYHYRIQPSATTCRTDWKITDRIIVFDMIQEFLQSRKLYLAYRDIFLRAQLEMFEWVYDTIANTYKEKVMELIQCHLDADHWAYIGSSDLLSWKTRDFYQATRGSIFSKIRRTLWYLARDGYRYAKKSKKSSIS